MGVPIEVYKVRIGCFYDRASKCKNKQQIDILTAIFANLLLCYGSHAVVIVLCIQLNNNYTKANNDVTNCVFVTQKSVSQEKLYTYHHCVTYSHIPCYLVPLSIVIVLCTILLIISGSVHVNPGPVVDNSYMSSYCSSLDSNTSTHGYCTNPKDMSSDFKSYLSLIHLNIQSIRPKLDIINAELSDFDVLCFTESWLDVSIKDQDISLEGFNAPFRHDRSDRPGGGVIVYCKDNLVCKRRFDLEVRGIECVWIEICMKNNNYLIGTFYRPPNSTSDMWDLLEHSIELAIDTQIKNIIITGDLNENQLVSGNTYIKSILTNYSLHQLINDPTSITETSATLIDVIITNNTNNIAYSKVCVPFLDVNVRYHCPVMCLIRSEKHNIPPFKRKIWLYDKGNYPLYRQMMSEVNWDNIIMDENSIEVDVNNLNEIILQLANENIPNNIITVRQKDLPWINNEIRKVMRQRNRLRRKAKKSNNLMHWVKFKQIRNKVVDLLRSAKRNYFSNLHDKIKTEKFGSKDWWKLVKKVSGLNNAHNDIKVLIDSNDKVINDNTDKANLLNTFFASQSTIDDTNKDIPDFDFQIDSSIDSITITEEDVTDFLLSLDTTKAYGHDSVSPKMLKEAYRELSVPLCKIYNKSLQTKKYPSQWKIANVVPVFKKSDPKKVENYRPISLLCIMSKIFEKCVHKYLHNYIVTNRLLSPHQSGFTKGDSTVNQLLYISEEFVKALDNGKELKKETSTKMYTPF